MSDEFNPPLGMDGDADLHPNRGERLACGCYAEPYARGKGWTITASAFLCAISHKKGDLTYMTHNDHEAARDVREATHCPATRDGANCFMTVGHAGKHAGVAKPGGPFLFAHHSFRVKKLSFIWPHYRRVQMPTMQRVGEIKMKSFLKIWIILLVVFGVAFGWAGGLALLMIYNPVIGLVAFILSLVTFLALITHSLSREA